MCVRRRLDMGSATANGAARSHGEQRFKQSRTELQFSYCAKTSFKKRVRLQFEHCVSPQCTQDTRMSHARLCVRATSSAAFGSSDWAWLYVTFILGPTFPHLPWQRSKLPISRCWRPALPTAAPAKRRLTKVDTGSRIDNLIAKSCRRTARAHTLTSRARSSFNGRFGNVIFLKGLTIIVPT